MCVTINWDFGTCEDEGDVQVHPVAYTIFNPEDISEGYLGDSGPSTTPEFSFNLDGFSNFFMIFQQVFPGNDANFGIGCTFRFRVDFGFCNQEASFLPALPDEEEERGHNIDSMLLEEPT